jgi:hypothetical protein
MEDIATLPRRSGIKRLWAAALPQFCSTPDHIEAVAAARQDAAIC